ncbi:carboxylesterase [Aspergillus cavernicola]|uniref:Carboxylesterase n=1 Tax=Aspergillus cavernicola TaxID=176166 RepID=A0ABR4IPU2_9EURO
MLSVLTPIGLAFALLSSFADAQLYGKTIQTSLGPVQGYKYFTNQTELQTFFGVNDSDVTAFLGIPYAADTGYHNRWKPPQPRTPWNETLNATKFGPACPGASTDYSEDCLSLNIWTNAQSPSDKLPVIVYSYGSDQTSDYSWYYGGGIAQKDVIFVTFNRRDDAFGFLAHPELNAESLAQNGHSSSGNYGILDHLEVLKWVNKNIAGFGGDPDRVTITGSSFGSSQVYHAINSELFKGLFSGGIAVSGLRYPKDTMLAGLATSYVNMSRALEFGQNYTTTHNASSIAELRTLPVESLLQGSQDRITDEDIWWVTALSAMYPLKFKPVLDNYILPEKYMEQLLTGPANDVPLITGNTRDESGAEITTSYTADEYREYNTLKYGSLADWYFALYPGGNSTNSASNAWRLAAQDLSKVSTWAFARDWVNSTAQSPIYTYFWDHVVPGSEAGAFHQGDVMYHYNSLYANSEYSFTEADYKIADIVSSCNAPF